MPKRLRRPQSKISLWPALWLVWAALVTVVLLGGVVLVPAQITVPRTVVYPGTLASGGAPDVVPLPAGAILQDIIVAEGEQVVAGQTVGVLDVTAMEAVLQQLKIDFLVARSVRRCFANHGSETLPPPANLVEEEDQIAIAAGVDRCRLAFQTRSEATKQRNLEIAHLAERRSLIQRRFDLHMMDPVPKDADKAKRAVDLMLARNGLDAQLLDLKKEQSEAAQEAEDYRIGQITKLADEIARIVVLQARLASHLTDPRLVAPRDGVILRVRTPDPSTKAADIDVIALRPDISAPPNLSILVPRQDLAALDEQRNVNVFAKGIPGWDEPFLGLVKMDDRFLSGDSAHASDTTHSTVAVPIQIEDAVVDVLKTLPIFNHAGGEAKADVVVGLGMQSLQKILKQEAKNLPLQRIFSAVERRSNAVKAALSL